MGQGTDLRGTARHDETVPNWGPLENLIGIELCSHFMWMFAVDLEDGNRLDAYKHRWTRRYFHLDQNGGAYFYTASGHYRKVDQYTAIAEVFVGWECCSPTPSEKSALRAALHRASGEDASQ